MFLKRSVLMMLVLMLSFIGVLTSCSTSTTVKPSTIVQPSPTTQLPTTVQPSATIAQPTTPAQATTPATTSVTPLDQIIAGAKKEGTVSVSLSATLNNTAIADLESAIKNTYGVSLDIKNTFSGNNLTTLSNAIMAYQSGAPPIYDLMDGGPDQLIPAIKAGIFEQVDWNSLLTSDVASKELVSIPSFGISAPSYYSSLNGIIYNPDKISADEAPKTLSDLANPKWQGKIGIPVYSGLWAGWTNFFGQTTVDSDLQAILKNGATLDTYPDEMNNYLLGENWIDLIGSAFYQEILSKNMAVKWQNPGAVIEEKYLLMVPKRALHPDAAELVAIYLASQAGSNLLANYLGNSAYSGNYAYDIVEQGKQQSLPYYFYGNLKYLAFVQSNDYPQAVNQINSILKNTK